MNTKVENVGETVELTDFEDNNVVLRKIAVALQARNHIEMARLYVELKNMQLACCDDMQERKAILEKTKDWVCDEGFEDVINETHKEQRYDSWLNYKKVL